MLLAVTVSVSGQSVEDGSKWFDGKVLYTAHVQESGDIFFDAPENKEQNYCFSLRKMNHGQGEYVLTPHDYTSEAPMRAQYGWRVQYIRKEGMYFLAVRNNLNEIVWTLTLTPDNLQNCLGQEKHAESRPIENMLDSYLMNTKYLSVFTKDTIRKMIGILESRQAKNIISQTNLMLMRNELKVVDSDRIF